MPEFTRTVASAVGGGIIGTAFAHIVNPALAHFGIGQIPQDVVTSVSTAGGATVADKVTKIIRSRRKQEQDKRRRADVEELQNNIRRALERELAKLASDAERSRVRSLVTGIEDVRRERLDDLLERLDARCEDWRHGLLSDSDFSLICTDIYSTGLMVVGEEIGKGLTPRRY